MTAASDSRRVLWALLALWIGIELLYSSRWWPPQPAGWSRSLVGAESTGAEVTGAEANQTKVSVPTLAALLAAQRNPRVWFAPYTSFPEVGALESMARRGVYDTFLAFPSQSPGGLAANYGASKLTPADTLFTLASAFGLRGEWQLARRLGYTRFALDIGALTDPGAAAALCRRTPGCRLSRDAYALFSLQGPESVAPMPRLAALQRRIPLLPSRSSGPSWGPLVFNPLQWSLPELPRVEQALRQGRVDIEAPNATEVELYRYPLSRYPAAVRSLVTLPASAVRLVLPPGQKALRVCIAPAGSQRCTLVQLNSQQPERAIGELIQAGGLTRLTIPVNNAGQVVPTTLIVSVAITPPVKTLLGPQSQTSSR